MSTHDIQRPSAGPRLWQMDQVGCVPLLGAWVGIRSSVSAWGLQKPGKKSKLPAGKATWTAGGAHRRMSWTFWMQPCPNSWPKGLGAMRSVQCVWGRGGG